MMPQQVSYSPSGNKPFARLSRKGEPYFQPYGSSSQFVSFVWYDLSPMINSLKLEFRM